MNRGRMMVRKKDEDDVDFVPVWNRIQQSPFRVLGEIHEPLMLVIYKLYACLTNTQASCLYYGYTSETPVL